jgi:cytochrome c-type biogenesis protein CcmE
MERQSSKSLYIVALVLLLAGLGYLIVSGASKDSVYFVTVAEAMDMDPAKLKQARLFGNVAEADLTRDPQSLGVHFRLLDKDVAGKAVMVDYKGAVPDTFKPGAEVIVEGGLDPSGQTFKATSLITKCPSKYEKQNRKS